MIDDAGTRSAGGMNPETPVEVHAGPLTAVLESGTVRWLTLAGSELVRGIYAAVRDKDWGTVRPQFTRYELERNAASFSLAVTAVVRREADGIDFEWQGSIAGARDGSVRFEFDGVAHRPFLRARIGLCVLHPPRLASRRLDVLMPWGTVRGRFPDTIAPVPPFTNIVELQQEPGSAREVRLRFDGDLFEMEDQRAFGDASFKTFSTPLSLAWPVLVEPGVPIRQVVTVQPAGFDRSPPRPAPHPGRRRDVRRIAVGGVIGTVPAIGTAMPSAGTELGRDVRHALRPARLQYIRADVPLDDGWRAALHRASALAAELGAALEVAFIGRAEDRALPEAVGTLRGQPKARLLLFDPDRHTSQAPALRRVREILRGAGVAAELGAGTRGYLSHLIAETADLRSSDFVAFPVSPQVHAFDDASVMESIEILPTMVETAALVAPGRPVIVGPVSLRPLFDPDLSEPPTPIPDELPARYDQRQASTFAAAWSVGTLAALASAHVAAITLHEAAGPGGLVAAAQRPRVPLSGAPGSRYPVFHAVQAAAAWSGSSLRASRSPTGIAALVAERPARLQILLANLTSHDREVSIPLPALSSGARPHLIAAERLAEGGWVSACDADGGRAGLVLQVRAYGVYRLELGSAAR